MFPGGWELIVIIGVLILLFGAKKLPDMARSIGQSARVFKGEMKGMKSDDEAAADPPPPAQAPPALPPAGPASSPQPEPQQASSPRTSES